MILREMLTFSIWPGLRHSALILLASLTVSAAAAPPEPVDVTGNWQMTVESPQGNTAHPSMVLKQDGEKLTGTYRGRMGESKLEGTVTDNRIRFSVTLKFQDQPFTIIYSGVVEQDTMTGTAQFGEAGSGKWSAQRKR
jgi:hypothetical protein